MGFLARWFLGCQVEVVVLVFVIFLIGWVVFLGAWCSGFSGYSGLGGSPEGVGFTGGG